MWPHVMAMIGAASDRTGISDFRTLAHKVSDGDALLWIATDGEQILGVIATQLKIVNRDKICEILACGGAEMSRWIGFLPRIEEFAKAEGCSAVRFLGRKGWLRALPSYRQIGVIAEKELDI